MITVFAYLRSLKYIVIYDCLTETKKSVRMMPSLSGLQMRIPSGDDDDHDTEEPAVIEIPHGNARLRKIIKIIATR